MILKQYIIKDDSKILSYIDGLDQSEIILKDYFYFTQNSLFQNSSLYSEKQVGRILNITDKEYSGLIENFFSDSLEQKSENDSSKKDQDRINEIDSIIKKSKDYEDALKKSKEVDLELEKIDKDLKSANEIDRKIADAINEFKPYANFGKFNLQKIHNDLVGINSQIEKLEEDLLSKKVIEIKKAKSQFTFDQGKIGLGIGILIGMGIFGLIFWILSLPNWISFTIWGVGVLVAFFFIAFSRYEIDIEDGQIGKNIESFNYNDINDLLGNLRSQRNAILQMLNLRNTNDFFLIKAKYSSINKSIEYLQNQKKHLSHILDLDELYLKKQEFLKQKNEFIQKISDPSVGLKADQYLAYYREMDTLKLNSSNKVTNIPKDTIPEKLKSIRKELLDKLPSYIEILKSTFSKNFEKISNTLKELISNNGVEDFTITSTLDEWNDLNNLQRFLIQFALAKEIYSENFVIILEEISNWSDSEILILKFLINQSEPNGEITILDYGEGIKRLKN